MSLFKFQKNTVYPSNQLPLTIISLEEWSFVYIEGVDSKEYLQSQLTIDMNLFNINRHTLCARCNFNGKVWSTMRFFNYKKGYAYIERKSISKLHVKELKKYSIFSKITIQNLKNIFLLGVAGLNAKSFLLNFFTKIPDKNFPVIHEDKITMLWFSKPSERFLLALSLKNFVILKKNMLIKKKQALLFNSSHQWLSLDLESGFPIIDSILSKKFTPQALNLEKLKAISFEKGCYYGQETVARIFFKSLNKYTLSLLVGSGDIAPKIGSCIETQIEKKWFKSGVVLAIVKVRYEEIWIQAVLEKPIDINNLFRISGFHNLFLIKN